MNDLEVMVDPPGTVITIVQDHGPNDGGWGPANVHVLGQGPMGPVIYSRMDAAMIEYLEWLTRKIAQDTGKETRLVRYRHQEDLLVIGGSS